jgi:hypothetical protein
MQSSCGYQGDPVCEPPNCGGACPTNAPDLRPPRAECAPERLPHTNVGDKGGLHIYLYACQCGVEEHQWQAEVGLERIWGVIQS